MCVGTSLLIAGLLLVAPLPAASASLVSSTAIAIGDVPDPVVTAVPEKRQDESPFVAWEAYSGYWFEQTCGPGSYYATRSDYGACCINNEPYCDFATACSGREVVYLGGGTGTCDPGHICDTITISASRGVADGAHSLLSCSPTETFRDATRVWYRNTYPLTTSTPAETQTQTQTQTKTVLVTVTADEDDGAAVHSPREAQAILGLSMAVIFLAQYGVPLL